MRRERKKTVKAIVFSNRINAFQSIVFSLVACFVFTFFSSATVAHAEATIINDSPAVTFTDSSGKVVKGALPKMKNVVPLTYIGSKLIDDITIQTGNDKPVKPNTSSAYFYVQQNQIVRAKNAGYYKGEPTTLAFRLTTGNFNCNTTGNMLRFTPSGSNTSTPVYEFWVEDSGGNKILDDTAKFLLPQNINSVGPDSLNQYLQYQWLNPNGIDNMIVQDNSSNALAFVQVDFLSDRLNLINSTNQYVSLGYSVIFRQSETPLSMGVAYYSGSYPNGTILNIGTVTMNSLSFFDPSITYNIPLLNPEIVINDTYNEETVDAKMDLTQVVYKQSNDNYYNDLTIHATLPDVLQEQVDLSKISITDKEGTDITSKVTMSYDDSTKKIGLVLPKTLLQSLGNNNISIKGDFNLGESFANLESYYSNSSKDFVFTLKADNSDNLEDDTEKPIVTSGSMTVKAPAPTGDPVAQTVYQGQSTSDFQAQNLVENLQSTFKDDSVKVIGFKEEKTFSTLGDDVVLVEIQSELTGTTAYISVPVTVEEKPKDIVYMQWKDTSAGGKNKVQEVDKSTMGDVVEEEFSWSTNLPNRDYVLSVRNINNLDEELFSQDLKTNGTIVDTMIESSFDLPTNLLTDGYRNNKFEVGIYLKGSNGKKTGEPLYYLPFVVNLQGSLQIVSVPSELKWTNRTITKGLLNRDINNEMEVKVIDTRNIPEADKNWSVSAQTEAIDGATVPFELQWKSDTSETPKTLAEKQITLTKDAATKSGDSYSKIWNENTGILLYAKDYLGIGDYSGKVKVVWNLYDTPTAE